MRATVAITTAALVLIPHFVIAQQAKPDSCPSVDLKAPALWIGASKGTVNLRTGPGANYPIHESGQLVSGEEVQVLQECHGWVQARAIPPHLIDNMIERYGLARARQMLLFWVRKDLLVRLRK